ncbi:MAG TPA: aspartate aminotransferase family protein [Oculatellaceae cyanobacterium]
MPTNTRAEVENDSQTSVQEQWLERGRNVLMETYASFPVVLASGKGSYVEDVNGKKYLDFCSGIAVNSLGHCNEDYMQALTKQLSTLVHCSNLYLNKPAIQLAEALLEGSAFDKAFFCNSGAEAIEGSLKLSRKYAKETKGEYCNKILTMTNSFHGRTYGALSATGQKKYQAGFSPLVPDFETATFNDFESVSQWDGQTIAAIVVEPIQGEGGVHAVDREFLQQIRNYCDREKVVLVFDEIQCGAGRTGKFFAYEQFGVAPDVIAMAKGLGGGFPIGAILAKAEIAKAFKPGDHGTTFGGNPLACTAALTCVETIKEPAFLEAVESKGKHLLSRLQELAAKNDKIKEIRGMGLMLGVEFTEPVKPIINACIEAGLLLIGAGEKVVRILPPLTVTVEEIDAAVEIFERASRKD